MLEETQAQCLKEMVPAGSILVGDIKDIEPLKAMLKCNDLPVPEVAVEDIGPAATLYDNLPPLKPLGLQLLQSMPPPGANHLIDYF